jgi:hypothetical protein
LTEVVIHEAENLIGKLNFDQLLGNAGTISQLESCRIDRQPPPAGGSNIQVQLNGIRGDSSVATCVIDAEVLASMADWPPGLRLHQEKWLLRQLRVALHRSLEGMNTFNIKGSFRDDDNQSHITPRQLDNYPPDSQQNRRHRAKVKTRK